MNALSANFLLVYAFRMVTISTLLYGYYLVFLRNRAFHTYNRWYLLGSIVLSFLLPLVHFSLHLPWLNDPRPEDTLMTIIRTGDIPVAGNSEAPAHHPFPESIFLALTSVCSLVTLLLLTRLTRSIYRIIRTARKYPSIHIGTIRFLQTNEPGAPFSFFNWLFWDQRIDAHQDAGRLIFLHESYHIRQRHTLDLLGLELARSLCWFNPFFHLITREIKMLHEFGADQYAVSGEQPDQQRHRYAELLVWQSVGTGQVPTIAHSFFYNQLKRRITMLTQNTHQQTSRITRIMAFPLLALLLGIFTTAPAQRIDTVPAKDKAKVLHQYNRNLRYPEKALAAGQEGSVYFAIRLGEGGKLVDYTPLDTPPEGKDVLKIVVTSYDSKTTSPASMTTEEAHTLFQDETRRSSARIDPSTVSEVAPGEYYLRISFRLEHPTGK